MGRTDDAHEVGASSRRPSARTACCVRVKAAGVNPVDTRSATASWRSAFPFHFPLILGWDAAGVVEKVGPAVTWFKPGDEVYGYCRRHHLQYGTYARVRVGARGLPRPQAELAVLRGGRRGAARRADRAPGARDARRCAAARRCSSAAAPGGVGHLAVQLGVARGARVIATASPANHDFLRELGAEPVDYHDADLAERIRARPATAASTRRSTCSAATAASRPSRCCAAAAGSSRSPQPPPEPRDGYETHYVFVRPRRRRPRASWPTWSTRAASRRTSQEVFPLERAADAHGALEDGHVRGKLVLRVD